MYRCQRTTKVPAKHVLDVCESISGDHLTVIHQAHQPIRLVRDRSINHDVADDCLRGDSLGIIPRPTLSVKPLCHPKSGNF